MKINGKVPKNKLTKALCEVFYKVYGDTLWWDDIDVRMAKAALRRLNPYLYVSDSDMSDKEFKIWRRKFIKEITGT